MKSLFTAFLVIVAMTLTAQTEATSTASAGEGKSLRQSLKDSPFSFTINTFNESSIGSGGEYSGNHRFYLNYALSDKDTITSETRYYNSLDNGAKSDQLNRTVLRYRRSKILEHDTHGFDLNAMIEKRFYVKGRVRSRYQANGHTGIGFDTLRRNGRWIFVQGYEFYNKEALDSNRMGAPMVGHYGFLGQDYVVNDTWTVGLFTELVGDHYNERNARYQAIVYPTVTHNIIPDLTARYYIAGVPFQSGDGQTMAQDWERELMLGLWITARVF